MKDLSKNQKTMLQTLAKGALPIADTDMRTAHALISRKFAKTDKRETKVTITAAGKKALN